MPQSDVSAPPVDPDEALRLVLQAAEVRPPRGVSPTEACGLQLAEAIVADRDYPPFARAMMDGYAVRTADAGHTVTVVGEVAAGQHEQRDVRAGHCFEIMTGAPCPPGTEAVVPKEEITRDADQVALPAGIPPGQHIAPKGSECRAGRVVLQSGEVLTPLAVAVIASVGVQSVQVVPRPSLAIITTGAELIAAGADPAPAQIRDSNGPMLLAMARDFGIERPIHRRAEDRLESIREALEDVAAADVVLLTGGVSAGKYDLVPDALEDYGARRIFHRVSQKPGKPLLLAGKGPQLIFGLPGNPLSCHFCFHRYVTAAIRKMENKPAGPESVRGLLAAPIEPKPDRTYFVPSRAEATRGGWRVHPLPGASSADMFATCRANCYVEVPPGEVAVPSGEVLAFTWIGGAPWPH